MRAHLSAPSTTVTVGIRLAALAFRIAMGDAWTMRQNVVAQVRTLLLHLRHVDREQHNITARPEESSSRQACAPHAAGAAVTRAYILLTSNTVATANPDPRETITRLAGKYKDLPVLAGKGARS